MKAQGLIMDMDGTLTDSMPQWMSVGDKYLIKQGIEPEPDLNDKLKTFSLKQSAEYFRSRYGIDKEWPEIIDGVMAVMDDYYRYDVVLKEGAAEFINYAQGSGVKLCVASSTESAQVRMALEHTGIIGSFEFIITSTESSGKDEPRIFEEALSRLGTEKENTWVVDDAYYALITAKNAGFRTAGIYDESMRADTKKISHLCDIYAENMSDLLEQMR
ncbi:MAG: HAD family phosphatase [Eubacteriaceae bacterium]|jgi:HAD superfamily hydrolase (TIGR01509 family)|nr:HAD family phosphatase [Eubacteriaceae bacterium]